MVWCQPTSDPQQETYMQFTLEIGIYCAEGSLFLKVSSWSFAALAILLIPLLLWLFRAAKSKEKRIIEPQGMPYQETYCTVSLQLIQLTKASIIFHCLVLPLQASLFLMSPDDLNRWYSVPEVNQHHRLCGEPLVPGTFNWLIIWRLLAEVPLMVVLDLIFWVQTVEWMAMNNLIENQKHKTVQQIMYDHTAEQMHQSIRQYREEVKRVSELATLMSSQQNAQMHHQVVYRRKERALRRVTRVITFSLAISLYFLYALFSVLQYRQLNTPTIAIRGIIFIVQLYYFSRLWRNMTRLHRYEFEKTRWNMLVQILISGITQLFRIFYLIIIVIFTPTDPACSGEAPEGDRSFAEFLYQSSLARFLILGVYVLYFENLVLDFAIARFKSSQDILQGVSKLDYLLKVSEFQRFKGSVPSEVHRASFGSVQSFERVSSTSSTAKDFDPSSSEDLRGTGVNAIEY